MRGFRVTVAGGTATMCRSGFVLYDFLPVSEMLNVVGSDRPRVPSPRRLSAQGAQPDEVPRQVARLGGVPHRVREGADRLPRRRRRDACRSIPTGRHPSRRRTGHGRRRTMSLTVARRVAEPTNGPGIHPVVKRDLAMASAEYLAWERSQRPEAASIRLRVRRRQPSARRHHVGTASRGRRPRGGLRRRHDPSDRRPGSAAAMDSRVGAEAASRPPGGGRLAVARWTVGRERHELSRGRVLQARGDAIARTRSAVERCVARASAISWRRCPA